VVTRVTLNTRISQNPCFPPFFPFIFITQLK
jgi:hypothetical protein